eukprot:6290532-Prymnesium_polylepis.1
MPAPRNRCRSHAAPQAPLSRARPRSASNAHPWPRRAAALRARKRLTRWRASGTKRASPPAPRGD